MSFRAILLTQAFKKCLNYSIPHITNRSPNFLFYIPKRFNHKLKCWQCGIERQNVAELFCEKCSFIQNPSESENFFKVFELKEKFDVDLRQLRDKYRKMQSQLHPDKFTNKSDKEKNISEEFSSLVNKAYYTLQTPLKRAIHLLHLRGQSIEEDQKVEDPEFLMEIMELNEEVENADTDEKLKKLKKKNDEELSKVAKEIEAYFNSHETEKAKQTIIKMKYYNSISLHINNLMREKGIVD